MGTEESIIGFRLEKKETVVVFCGYVHAAKKGRNPQHEHQMSWAELCPCCVRLSAHQADLLHVHSNWSNIPSTS